MKIKELDLDEIINPGWIISYKNEIDRLWAPIIDINSYIFILDKIFNFPLELFQPLRLLFWKLLIDALYGQIILKMYIVIVDSNKSSSNIANLRSMIIKNAKSENIKSAILRDLKQIDFDKKIKAFKEKIILMRNKYFAHIDADWRNNIQGIALRDLALEFNELKMVASNINTFFEYLCLSEGRSPYYSEYAPDEMFINRSDVISDIEEILLMLARESDLLNMPEVQPEFWPHFKEANISSKELAIFNDYRKKFGLPEVK